jgi:hypothetical protein
MRVELEPGWPEADAARLRGVGYTVARATSAVVGAVGRDPVTGAFISASR